MQQSSSSKFSESALLAYVEQTMPPADRAAFEAQIAGDARLLASLQRMQADCEALRALPDDPAPSTLAADVLAGVERAMLVEEDLVAPPIDMRRYRASHWQRYAAAAGFVLLLTGGSIMLVKMLHFDSTDTVFAPNLQANGESGPALGNDSGNDSIAVQPQPESQPQNDLIARSTAPAEVPTARESSIDLAEFEAAMVAPVQPAVIAAIGRDWPTDLDLFADVVTGDPEQAFDTIASRLRARGGDLIVNASINVPGVSLPSGGDPGPSASREDRSRPAPAAPGAVPVPVNPDPAVTDPDDRVPLLDQSHYAAAGYQFTLLGTPSDILSVLRELGADRSLRFSWSHRASGSLLVDLVAPNLPPSTRWDRVMFWWVDPETRFDEARAAVAQASTEPFIRIPVRIVASTRR